MNIGKNKLTVEDRIASLLMDKTISEININLRNLIYNLFPEVNKIDLIFAKSVHGIGNKANLIIGINHEYKSLNIISYRQEIVHVELFPHFIEYLKLQGISSKTIETIQLHHYGDDTVDGTGEEKKNYVNIKEGFLERIYSANEELNKNRKFVIKAVTRSLLFGSTAKSVVADALYYGDEKQGIFISKQQLIKHALLCAHDKIKALHIGPLILQPGTKQSKCDNYYLLKKHRLILYWPYLEKDLIAISKKYDK